MLSSTAKNLYWMGRYLQRAKSTARLIEATQRMALQSRGEEAAGVAAIFGMEDEFRQTQEQSGGRLASLIDFLVIDENNPSSLVSSIGAARRNAREERNNITVDVWESLNALWLELNSRLRVDRTALDRGALIESVKKQAVMIFGAAQVTLLRDEAYARFFHSYDASPLLIVNSAAIDPVNNESDYQQLFAEIVEECRGECLGGIVASG
jgi:uncharacterized alpha-E superfamily protein